MFFNPFNTKSHLWYYLNLGWSFHIWIPHNKTFHSNTNTCALWSVVFHCVANHAPAASHHLPHNEQEDCVNSPCSAEISVQNIHRQPETRKMTCDLGNWVKVTHLQSHASPYRALYIIICNLEILAKITLSRNQIHYKSCLLILGTMSNSKMECACLENYNTFFFRLYGSSLISHFFRLFLTPFCNEI